MNNAIQWTITPLTKVIADAKTIENADHRLGFVHAHLSHRDEAIEDLHETVAELSRELDRLRELATQYGCHTAGPSLTQLACKRTIKRREDSATPASVQEFVAKTIDSTTPSQTAETARVQEIIRTAWDMVPVGGGA